MINKNMEQILEIKYNSEEELYNQLCLNLNILNNKKNINYLNNILSYLENNKNIYAFSLTTKSNNENSKRDIIYRDFELIIYFTKEDYIIINFSYSNYKIIEYYSFDNNNEIDENYKNLIDNICNEFIIIKKYDYLIILDEYIQDCFKTENNLYLNPYYNL